MDEVDFYLEDLKSKFSKIDIKEYTLLLCDNIETNLLKWFIYKYIIKEGIKTSYLKTKNTKYIIPVLSEELETCFDKDGNFYPVHDLPVKLRNEIVKKYEI